MGLGDIGLPNSTENWLKAGVNNVINYLFAVFTIETL